MYDPKKYPDPPRTADYYVLSYTMEGDTLEPYIEYHNTLDEARRAAHKILEDARKLPLDTPGLVRYTEIALRDLEPLSAYKLTNHGKIIQIRPSQIPECPVQF